MELITPQNNSCEYFSIDLVVSTKLWHLMCSMCFVVLVWCEMRLGGLIWFDFDRVWN